MTDLLTRIAAIVGPQGMLTGEDVAGRAADFMGFTRVQAKAIVRPASTAELSEVMKLCHAARQPVVPAGGYTGLVQGAVCQPDDIQISLERMRAIEEIDPVGRTMTVGAGLPVQAAQEAALEHGLQFPVDWGARGSATIGGGISTNAGGNSVVRFGMMRDSVLGLEAVLADGTVISAMNRLIKNNAAYDLKHLFIGSEGTLGIVTRAVLKLQSAALSTQTALVALEDFAAVQALFVAAGKRLGAGLTAFEVMWANFYEPIAIGTGRHTPPLPGGHGFYVIVEMSGTDAERDPAQFEEVLAGLLENGIAADAVIAASQTQAAQIWAIRDDIEALFHYAAPSVTFDVSLPIRDMGQYVEALEAKARAELGETTKLVVFGHMGDGNLHILLGAQPFDAGMKHRIEKLVFTPLQPLGGSISAEHGIGLEKRQWLHLSRTAEELALMRTLKTAMDPECILNPGKVLP
ncbi:MULTISPECIES: FAD-binding oxidoreductase [unclassified Novosphingobium]|uniref:FAD-binding oxidoreductase n=1 Tax=unclassified Novosphingobium TaxID=2644732 RepID=UPI0025FD1C77|nr:MULTISPECIES: FAD-binding oxidoreductase [unclassified Novosphingobium]HQV04735.1 FAD-binding oxidoreductase [Novosphingobium sp.]